MNFRQAYLKKTLTFSSLIVLLAILDQLSKYMVRTRGGFYICNKGIAFGISAGSIVFWALVIGVVYFCYQTLNAKLKIADYKFLRLAMVLVVSGAVSNLLDRLLHGCVIDFIDLSFWPVFNLADIFIVAGAILIISQQFRKSAA
jgi:signal peptidase II